jgi:hypothetical protein
MTTPRHVILNEVKDLQGNRSEDPSLRCAAFRMTEQCCIRRLYVMLNCISEVDIWITGCYTLRHRSKDQIT